MIPSMIPSSCPRAAGELSAETQDRISLLYSELEREVRALGVGCWVRGDCCDFDRVDHQLFASSLEIAHVRAKHPAPFPADSRLCPFWLDGRCTERERRPLGCRTYFCDRRYKEQLEALYETYHRRLRTLAASEGLPWAYLPFVTALRTEEGGTGP